MTFKAAFTGVVLAGCVVALAGQAGCTSTGIAVREQLGYAKREQLVDRVQEARDAQETAKEQFGSALEEFLALTGSGGTKLEQTYKRLRDQAKLASSRADTVRSRIKSVEGVSGALFKEWEQELAQYKTESLRAQSESMLRSTKSQYDRLMAAMKSAEAKMQPVLDVFNEQVLFLKHNLNAQAIASLGGTVTQVENDVASLIRELEQSISEANTFIDSMAQPSGS